MITTYSETDLDLKVNKIDRETFDTLSAQQISPKELWFITSADSVVVDIDKIGVSRDWTPEISALSSEIEDVETQIQDISAATDISAIQERLDYVDSSISAVNEQMAEMSALADYIEDLSAFADLSAIEAMVDGKRDYDDLTYDIEEVSSIPDPFTTDKMNGMPSGDASAINAYRAGMDVSVDILLDPLNNPKKVTFAMEYVPAIYDEEEERVIYGYWQNPYDAQYGEVMLSLYWYDDVGFRFEGGGDIDTLGIPAEGSTSWEVSSPDNNATVYITMPSTTSSIQTTDKLALESQLSAYVPQSQFNLSALECSAIEVSGIYDDDSTFSYQFVIQGVQS